MPLSWVLLHGNMRRDRGMQREGTGPMTTREEFTSGEETSESKVTAKGGDREDRAREEGSEVREREGKWRCSLPPHTRV